MDVDRSPWREILASSGAAVVVADGGGTIRLAAGPAAFFAGRSASDVEGEPLSAIVAETDWPLLESMCTAPDRFAGGARIDLRTADGGRLDVGVSTARLDSAPDLTVLWLRDCRAEDAGSDSTVRARQNYESVGQIASGIAHGFNNLLTGVLGNLRLAADLLDGNSTTHALIEDATRAAERAAELTRQLLLLSGGGQAVRERIHLPDVVIDTSQLLHNAISAKIRLRLDVDSDLPAVLGDPVQIRQALFTLLMNGARSIGDQAGTLLIRASTVELDAETIESRFPGQGLVPGRAVLFELRDTGPGLDPAATSRLFDRGGAAERAGLSSVQHSIQEHGGAVTVESERGQGTTFRIVLPAASNESPAPAPASRQERTRPLETHPSGTVLVVDDEDMVTRLTRSILSKAGYPVMIASSGEEALNLIEAGASAISLVVLDLTMAGFSCDEILDRIRTTKPDLPVTISSGYPEHEVMSRFSRYEGLNFLQKPFTKTQLLDRVSAAIGIATPHE